MVFGSFLWKDCVLLSAAFFYIWGFDTVILCIALRTLGG